MTPDEILARFNFPPGDPTQFLYFAGSLLHHISKHVHEAQLRNGQYLHDATDFSDLLTGVAAEARLLAKRSTSDCSTTEVA